MTTNTVIMCDYKNVLAAKVKWRTNIIFWDNINRKILKVIFLTSNKTMKYTEIFPQIMLF